MSGHRMIPERFGSGWAAVLLAGLLTGCASAPKADWNARVGHYTYDQAVQELGPPDRSAQISGGATVAEWFVKQNASFSFGVGTGSYGSHGGVGVGQSVTTGGSARFLRLTFDPEGRLTAWDHVNR